MLHTGFRVALGLLALGWASGASATDWRFFATTLAGTERQAILVDSQSVKIEGATRSYAVLSVRDTASVQPEYLNAVHIADCAAGTFKEKGGASAKMQSSTYGALARSVCDNTLAALPAEPSSFIGGRLRLRQMQQFETALTGDNWHRIAAGGTAPNRYAFLVDRTAATIGSFNGAVTLLVLETPQNGAAMVAEYSSFECSGRTAALRYQRGWNKSGTEVMAKWTVSPARPFADAFLVPIEPVLCGRNWNGADWIRGKTPAEIATKALR